MRALVIGGGHSAFFVVNTLKEIDPNGEIVIVETTIEKAGMAQKQFPFAEVLSLEIDEILNYVKGVKNNVDVLVVCTGSDALNLRIARAAVEAGVHRVISVINNPLNEPYFKKARVRLLIDPYSIIETKLKELLGVGLPVKIYEGLEKRVALYSIIVPKKIKIELEREPHSVYLLAKSKTKITAEFGMDLEKGDVLYIFGEAHEARNIAEKLSSKMKKGS